MEWYRLSNGNWYRPGIDLVLTRNIVVRRQNCGFLGFCGSECHVCVAASLSVLNMNGVTYGRNGASRLKRLECPRFSSCKVIFSWSGMLIFSLSIVGHIPWSIKRIYIGRIKLILEKWVVNYTCSSDHSRDSWKLAIMGQAFHCRDCWRQKKGSNRIQKWHHFILDAMYCRAPEVR